MKCQVDPEETIKVINKNCRHRMDGAVVEMRNKTTEDTIRVSLSEEKTKKLIRQLESTLGK